MTLLFFRDFFMSYVEILKYNSASFITYSVIWVAREVIFRYWYTNIYAADVSAQVFLNFLKCNARVIWNPRAPVGGNPWRTGGFNLIFTRFRLPCSQGMHLFFSRIRSTMHGGLSGVFVFRVQVACSQKTWRLKWFQYSCVGMTEDTVLPGKCFCPGSELVYTHTLLGVLQYAIICVGSALLLKVIFLSYFSIEKTSRKRRGREKNV